MYSTMPDNWVETYGNEKKAKAGWQSYNEYLSTSVFYEGKRALLEFLCFSGYSIFGLKKVTGMTIYLIYR